VEGGLHPVRRLAPGHDHLPGDVDLLDGHDHGGAVGVDRLAAGRADGVGLVVHLADVTDVAGGGGEGEASPDYLWWPPDKISARYLAPLLYHGEVHHEPDPPTRSLDVEVSLPKEWHEQPMMVDPNELPSVE
jgi:hypothetical protein